MLREKHKYLYLATLIYQNDTMKKFLLSIAILTSIAFLSYEKPQYAHTNQAGAPIGKTGSPGDGGQTCTGCHSPNMPQAGDFLSINDFEGTEVYEAGETYTFEVIADAESSMIFGFEATVEDELGNKIGELLVGDVNTTQLINSGNHITHTMGGTFSEDLMMFWEFSWTAPEDFSGIATIYAAAIIANGDGDNTFDVTLTAQKVLEFADIVVDVEGCMDPIADNYNADATINDNSCLYTECIDITFDIDLASYAYNHSWELVNSNGVVVYSEGGESLIDVMCLAYDVYTFNAYDSYGDGWNNGVYEITAACNGNDILLANNNGESPQNSIGGPAPEGEPDLESSEQVNVVACSPCLGFSVNAEIVNEVGVGTSSGSITLTTNYGTSPFNVEWSNGSTDFTIEGLTAGYYTATITDAFDCVFQETYEVSTNGYQIDEVDEITSCNNIFTDSGGEEGDFEAGEYNTVVICPDDEELYTQLYFSEFDLGWGATLTIYDGDSSFEPFLESGSYDALIGQVITATEDNVSGCLTVTFTGPWSSSYVESGWIAEISCHEYIYFGCMDPEADNYDPLAEQDDNTCYYNPGCMDEDFIEYHTQGYVADHDDGSCISPYVDGCMDVDAFNYSPDATYNLYGDPCVYDLDDWECGMHFRDQRDNYTYATVQLGDYCWMAENLRYVPENANFVNLEGIAANVTELNNGFIYTGTEIGDLETNGRYYTWESAEESVPYGWHLPTEVEVNFLIGNYSHLQLLDQDLFDAQESGFIISQNGEQQFSSVGVNSSYWTDAFVGEGIYKALLVDYPQQTSLVQPLDINFALSVRAVFGFPDEAILGCTDEDYVEYNALANYDDGSCETVIILGCTDETALNYNEIATVDDDSCIPTIEGCMDDEFAEYDETATLDDGSCITPAIFGCTDENTQNYNPEANVDDGSCIAHILGCTDYDFVEYDEDASQDDGSCITPAIHGCMDETAFNYNNAANVDDGSCVGHIEGCTNPNYIEFNGQANVDDGSCNTPVVFGCIIDYALNYNPLANTDDGSCMVEGCMNDNFVEYDENANIDDGSCAIIAIWGCTDDMYIEYFQPANMDDGSCVELIVEGCTDNMYMEFILEANVDDGSCQTPVVVGCTDPNYLEYDPLAVVENNTCETLAVPGCMDDNYIEYNPLANTSDDSCNDLIIVGCMDDNYIEFNPYANVADNSCVELILEGCMDDNYIEYNPNANVNDGSCTEYIVLGCIDALAFNYDPMANTDDGSCVPVEYGCWDSTYLEFAPWTNTEDNDLCLTPIVYGCTDEEAANYNEEANTDDGSCITVYAEIIVVGYADGYFEFTPEVIGFLGDYTVLWDFGNGEYSSEHIAFYQYPEDGEYEVTLTVANGDVDMVVNVTVECVGTTFDIDDYDSIRIVVSTEYIDLMGRRVAEDRLQQNQIYIKRLIYDDGSIAYIKSIKK